MDTHEYTLETADGLGQRIHAHRLQHGITQRELADQLGVTQQSVARWEQGSPPRRYMLRALETMLEEAPAATEPSSAMADIIGIRPPVTGIVPARGAEEARKAYVQGCLKLLERGERLPNRVLLLLADELGFGAEDA